MSSDTCLALWEATIKGQTKVIERIIRQGIHPDVDNKSGMTALQIAFNQKYDYLAFLLINYGADINKTNITNFPKSTVYMYANGVAIAKKWHKK